MRYISTRGKAPELGFEDVLLTGLARDGGLYVPKTWPQLSAADLTRLSGLTYAETAFEICRLFTGDAFDDATLKQIMDEVYGSFGHTAVAPLKQLDANLWMMELFHGPTLAFKDYAMQVLGRMFDHVLAKRGEKVTIVGATSGDTGSAAIQAFRDRSNAEIFIFFPKGRVSPVQQHQMTTVHAPNVHAIALEGTFDDCQDMVKALFNDADFRDRHNLSAVNSINWARILPQVVYYVTSALSVGATADRPVSFVVPTGNFGNIFAAYAAKQMGLPIDRLVVATNQNDILSRFLSSGEMKLEGVMPSISPSMDIQVSSNFERFLFDLYDRDGAAVTEVLTGFRKDGSFSISQGMLEKARAVFDGYRTDEAETKATIKAVFEETGEITDPHSAVSLGAARKARASGAIGTEMPLISLACAHAAKFPDAVEAATGIRPALPARLSDLLEREERMTVLANDYGTVSTHIAGIVSGKENAA
ncbi:threonine synthase [Nisaea sediminum]|uniref:threonine synthase n=1 Tax=Nisaea sediminum TaxID=2775867 RepID=UPI0018679EAE|nr:threonine synthase [Nisaea sediminum]